MIAQRISVGPSLSSGGVGAALYAGVTRFCATGSVPSIMEMILHAPQKPIS